MNAFDTRSTLIGRLKNWRDSQSWEDFFEAYWRLIYSVALKAGCNEQEAQDVVQDTIISVAREMPTFQYDRSKGSFRSWLLRITSRRIVDQLKKRAPAGRLERPPQDSRSTTMIERIADSGADFDVVWDEEWHQHLIRCALEKIKQQVNPIHYAIFERYIMDEWPSQKIANQLGVSLALVYVAKHRVGKLVEKEIKAMEKKLV